MSRLPASWLEVVRTPEPDLMHTSDPYAHAATRRAGRLGFHIVINEPRRGRWVYPAHIIAGTPADPRWDDGHTLLVSLQAPTATMHRVLLTAAWDKAVLLGHRRLAGCLGRHRPCGTGRLITHPHRGDHLDSCGCPLADPTPCAQVTSTPGKPGRGYPVTANLWVHRLRNPTATWADADPDGFLPWEGTNLTHPDYIDDDADLYGDLDDDEYDDLINRQR
jgi:hypothetical protein